MLTPGQRLELTVDKPAAGGRMIARHEGQIVFVLGAIPAERVVARIERVERQLAFAEAIEVLDPSPDRRAPFTDPLCGGCLYAHIAYPAQLRLKADVIVDAFRRLGHIDLAAVEVAPSPEEGYRMRGRLHVQGREAGFYREGTHTLCDAASTKQLTPDAVAVALGAVRTLHTRGVGVVSVEVSESIAADERALHLGLQPDVAADEGVLRALVDEARLTGCSARSAARSFVAGNPSVADPLAVLTSGRAARGTLSRRAEAFFQANRYLLPQLVADVLDSVRDAERVLELYAGVGLFSAALASTGRTGITAVEGDRSSAADLRQNAAQFGNAVRVVAGSVEQYLSARRRQNVDCAIVDPPRTGISKSAMQAIVSLGARRIVYVSCDPATMARDARRLLDAGYSLERLRAFDLFPNTPHVECVGVFAGGVGPTRVAHAFAPVPR